MHDIRLTTCTALHIELVGSYQEARSYLEIPDLLFLHSITYINESEMRIMKTLDLGMDGMTLDELIESPKVAS